MFVYKIFGLQPGFNDGVTFNSCVRNLQSQPDLWLDECPYLHTLSLSVNEDMRVELVKAIERTPARPTSVALAA